MKQSQRRQEDMMIAKFPFDRGRASGAASQDVTLNQGGVTGNRPALVPGRRFACGSGRHKKRRPGGRLQKLRLPGRNADFVASRQKEKTRPFSV